jgi:hypothetical protein
MAISLNPVDLVKLWKEGRKDKRQSFIGWLTAVQKELKAFLGVWMEIRDELESAGSGRVSFEGWPKEKWHGLHRKLNLQSVMSTYMHSFYDYASIASGSNLSATALDLFVVRLGSVINDRNQVRGQLEALTGWWADKQFYFLSEENQDNSIDSVRDAIDKLTREIVALDVLIETVKANPDSFK